MVTAAGGDIEQHALLYQPATAHVVHHRTLMNALMRRRVPRLCERLLGPGSPAFCRAFASCCLRTSSIRVGGST